VAAYGAGLSKFFEGSIVARYEHDPENRRSLSDNRVYRLAMDSSGKIWVATWGCGLDAFDVDAESFEHYRYDPKDPSSLPNDVSPERDQAFWSVSKYGFVWGRRTARCSSSCPTTARASTSSRQGGRLGWDSRAWPSAFATSGVDFSSPPARERGLRCACGSPSTRLLTNTVS